MTNLELLVGKTKDSLLVNEGEKTTYKANTLSAPSGRYRIFTAQYFEPMTGMDSPQMLTPTACSIKGVPVIDDF